MQYSTYSRVCVFAVYVGRYQHVSICVRESAYQTYQTATMNNTTYIDAPQHVKYHNKLHRNMPPYNTLQHNAPTQYKNQQLT